MPAEIVKGFGIKNLDQHVMRELNDQPQTRPTEGWSTGAVIAAAGAVLATAHFWNEIKAVLGWDEIKAMLMGMVFRMPWITVLPCLIPGSLTGMVTRLETCVRRLPGDWIATEMEPSICWTIVRM